MPQYGGSGEYDLSEAQYWYELKWYWKLACFIGGEEQQSAAEQLGGGDISYKKYIKYKKKYVKLKALYKI